MATWLLMCCMVYPADISPLPAYWYGTYKGTLALKSPGKPASEVPIELEIKPTGDAARVTWQITYGEGNKKSVRPYELVVLDRRPNYYELDEKSGIKMQMHMVDNKLYCLFKTSGSLLHAQYELKIKERAIHYEISTYVEKNSLKTAHENNTELEVDSYQLISVQSAVLREEPAVPKGATKK